MTDGTAEGRVLVVLTSDDAVGGEDDGDGEGSSERDVGTDAAVETGSGRTERDEGGELGGYEQGEQPPIVDGLTAQLAGEVIVRCGETAVEYVSELGPTLDCIVVIGDDTDLFRGLVEAAEIPIIVYDSTVIAVADATVPESNVLEELSERVRSEIRSNMDRSRLRESNARLTALSRYAEDITACETVDEVMERTVEAMSDALAFESCIAGLVSDGRLLPIASTLPEPGIDPISVDEGIVGRAYRTGEPQLVDDMQTDPDAALKGDGRRAAVTAPIGDRGAIQAVSNRCGAFDTRDLEFLEILAGYAEEALARIEREVTLREERDRLHTLFEDLPMPALCVERRDGGVRVEDANVAYADRFGDVTVRQPLSKTVSEAECEQYSRAFETGEITTATIERATEDGPREFAIDVVPASIPGVRECVFGLYRDRSVR